MTEKKAAIETTEKVEKETKDSKEFTSTEESKQTTETKKETGKDKETSTKTAKVRRSSDNRVSGCGKRRPSGRKCSAVKYS